MRRKFRRFLLLFGTGAVLVLAYCVIKRDALMLAYLVNTSVQPRQLSERRLRPAFELITGHPLPQRVESLQGIFRGGHEPSIFLRFASDSENIGRFRAVGPIL